MKRTVSSLLSLALLILATGCAQMAANDAKRYYEELLNPLVGWVDRDEMLITMGAPTKQEKLGSFEVWTYYKSFGQRGSVWVTPTQYATVGSTKSWEAYDFVRLYFNKPGILVKWDGYFQR